AQEIVEVRNVVDLFRGDRRIVFHAAKRQLSGFLYYIARTGIAIAGLADRSYIAHKLLLLELVRVTGFIRRHEVATLGEDARHVRMALKATEIYHAEKLLNLFLIVDIFRKNIFVDRIARRPMHEQQFAVAIRAGQGAQKIPAAVDRRPISLRLL